jgi:sortase A
MKKRKSTTIILVIIFLVGLCVLLYPTISDYVNQNHAAEVIVSYDENVEKMAKEKREQMLADAKAYNESLVGSSLQLQNGDPVDDEYSSLLDVDGEGMIGYITITKIDVRLPIYHGTSSDTLAKYAGHIEGSSLPVGGKSTHAIISGHRGLPSAKLFTDLDEMEVGDTFTITVLDKVLTYEVDQIRIVEPEELSDLGIVEVEDYVTLVTCTPYGVNTHRLLVRGKRIKTAENASVTSDALQIDTRLVAICIAIPILLAFAIWVSIHYRKKNNKSKDDKKEA